MKTIIALLTIFSACLPVAFSVQAQGESNIWYFGNKAGLDFNAGTPVALTNSAMNVLEGCATISDSLGSLLFYTDGSTVWNSDHASMLNGTDLAGSNTATQSAIIVPMPGINNSNYYYIFTTETTDSLRYSVVDMSLDSGKGDIYVKNKVLSGPGIEKLIFSQHANKVDYWIVTNNGNPNMFRAYLLSDLGIIDTVLSNVGSIDLNDGGYLKISYDGKKMAAAIHVPEKHFELYDFDNTTGKVSNAMYIPLNITYDDAYGVEFSADGKILYGSGRENSVSVNNKIYQWNISLEDSADIVASRIIIDSVAPNTFGALQLGPDGKIYVARNNSEYLGIIESPDSLGTACNYIEDGVFLGGNKCKLGLPPILSYNRSSTITSISKISSTQFYIYPNPAKDFIYLKPHDATDQVFLVKIFSVDGREVIRWNYVKRIMDISELDPGSYIIAVLSENYSVVQKLIISR